MDWCVENYANANHNPVAHLNGDRSTNGAESSGDSHSASEFSVFTMHTPSRASARPRRGSVLVRDELDNCAVRGLVESGHGKASVKGLE